MSQNDRRKGEVEKSTKKIVSRMILMAFNGNRPYIKTNDETS
jgi:hypothetical protein